MCALSLFSLELHAETFDDDSDGYFTAFISVLLNCCTVCWVDLGASHLFQCSKTISSSFYNINWVTFRLLHFGCALFFLFLFLLLLSCALFYLLQLPLLLHFGFHLSSFFFQIISHCLYSFFLRRFASCFEIFVYCAVLCGCRLMCTVCIWIALACWIFQFVFYSRRTQIASWAV